MPTHDTLRRLSTQFLAALTAVPLAALAVGCSGAPSGEDTGTSNAALSSNEKAAYDYFVGKGLKDYQAAGIVGNLMQESNVDPSSVQYGGGPGRGIAQWSVGGRWNADTDDNVVWYAGAHGASATSLDLQLDFVWYELTTFGNYGLSDLRGSSNITNATIAFQDDFEGCGECDQSTRIDYAEQVLAAFGGSSGGGGGTGGGSPPDACDKGDGFCTATLQCDNGQWIARSDDPAACTTVDDVDEPCSQAGGYCTATLQCDGGHWVPRQDDPNACTSGPG
ncbi:MAG: phage tail tip lysozyme [Polyangiaceae bacterium]|jgi:hypothetical protein